MVNKSSSRRWRIFIPVIIIGFIVVIILLFSYNKGIQMTAKYAPLVDASMEIKLEATNAHLWLEEILRGDRREDIEVVWKHIDMADWYAKVMLEGGQNPEGTFLPLEDEEMRRHIIDVRKKLDEFLISTQKRFEEKETSAAGTDIDQQYHVIFENFIQQADIVETMLQQLITKDLQQFRIIQISLTITIILLTTFVGIVIKRYERRKRENIYELENINKSMQDEITERKRAEEKLKATNQQLMASEQQLKAVNQQLEAGNQQLRASEQQLKAANQQLGATNLQLIASEQEIQKHAHDLGERVKELGCFYGISESIRTRENIEEILQDTARIIPPSWHYPGITSGKVRFNGKEYVSQAFKESKWKQSADIIVGGKVKGSIEVYYLEECPELDEGPFMKEERNLIDGMVKTISEAIELKQAEEKLRQSEEKYHDLYDNAPDMFVSVDAKTSNIMDCNQTLVDALGYSKEEVLGRPIFDMYQSDSNEDAKKAFKSFVETGEVRDFELQLERKDGNKIDVSLNASAVCDEDGNVLYSRSVWRDITEHKKVEEKLTIKN